jgi:dTDP-4-amino-4,6-dideoxygalactose transaminase
MYKVPLSEIDMGKAEIQAVLGVLKSQWLTLGEVTAGFEREFAQHMKIKDAVAVSSGTAALHLANLVLNIGPGDEVILPSLTFVATVNAVLYCGATPVFADIKGLDDLNIDPEEIVRKITPRTKAICVVHYGGYPADMDRILAIANDHGLCVIEDAAHGIGAELNGIKLGAFGNVGCFSFFSNKNMITGEGGMLVTQDPELARKARRLRSHGMTSLSWDRYKGHASSYDVKDLGFNYRITEIASAIGRTQLKKLNKNNQKRAMITEKYKKSLKDVNGLALPFYRYRGKPSYHLFPVIFPNQNRRDHIQSVLREAGIQTSIHYPPVHRFEYYRKRYSAEGGLPVTEDVAARELSLPLFPGMTQEQICIVTTALIKSLS